MHAYYGRSCVPHTIVSIRRPSTIRRKKSHFVIQSIHEARLLVGIRRHHSSTRDLHLYLSSMKNLLTVVFLFAAAVGLSSAVEPECDAENASSSSSTKIRIGLEWFLNPDHLPLVVALRHGLFLDFGLDVELVEPKDHWEAEEEILEGRLDVAVTEPLHLAQDAAKNKPVLGFSRFLHTDGGVLYDRSSGITRPADMCGKTISYPGSPGPGGPAIIQTMVEADGGDCDIKSYGKYNGGFYHVDALESGKADIATLIFANFEIPEARARGMDDVGFFSLKDWGVPDFCQLVLFTTPKRYEEQKGALRKLVLAMRKATGIIHQQPDVARETYYAYVREKNGDEAASADETQKAVMDATMTATLPAFPNDNSLASSYYARLMTWLVKTKQVGEDAVSKAPVSKYWTNEIAW